MTAYNEKVVKPLKIYYKDKGFTIGDLGLNPLYEAALYRFVKCRRRNGDVEGITYKSLRSFSGIGKKRARAITEALVKQGVVIIDIPAEARPVKLTVVGSSAAECSSCHAILTTNMDITQQLYRYCPMCGKKFEW